MRFISFSSIESENLDDARWMIVFTSEPYAELGIEAIRKKYPNLIVFGMHSFHGVCTEAGFVRGAFALVSEVQDLFDIQVELLDLTHIEPSENARINEEIQHFVKKLALDASQDFLFLHTTPGIEERILEGIQAELGTDVKLAGATAASENYLEPSQLFLNEKVTERGCLLGRLKQSSRVIGRMKNGFLPTRFRGVVTKSDGREIYTINDIPAAEIYNLWTERYFERSIRRGGLQPKYVSTQPLGRVLPNQKSVYAVSDPYLIDKNSKSIKFFSEIPEMTEVVLLRGNEKMMVYRVSEVIKEALGERSKEDILGAVFVYCASCTNIIGNAMNDVCERIQEAIDNKPFIGISSYGEQGRLSRELPLFHGNLICGVVLFLKPNEE